MPPQDMDHDQLLSLKLMVVLSKTYKSIADQAAKDIKKYGLSASEFGILEVLYSKGRIPLQHIGEKILITSGTMTYNIDKLSKRGLLKRIPCLEDRRVIYAELTAQGKELFDQIFPQHAASLHSKMNALTRSEKQQAIDLLRRLGKGGDSHDYHPKH